MYAVRGDCHEEGGRAPPKEKSRKEWNEGTRPMWRAGHAPQDEMEPDMDHDPTLAACCVRELGTNRKNRIMMDDLRSAMPGTLVNKHWISSDVQEHHHDCGCCANDLERSQKNAEIARKRTERRRSEGSEENSDDEINRLLDEVDDDMELVQIRDARMDQLRQAAEAQKQQHKHDHSSAHAPVGQLSEVRPEALIPLVAAQLRVVALLCPTDGRDRGGGGDEAQEVTLARHLRGFAPEMRGTVFVAVPVAGKQGDQMLKAVRTTQLPAVVCFREGVIVARACGNLRQFIQMGDVGQAVFRAWLWQTRTMAQAMEDTREKSRAVGSDDEEEPEGGGSSRRAKQPLARAVFQTPGEASATCALPHCCHKFKHEHLASRGEGEENHDDEEDVD